MGKRRKSSKLRRQSSRRKSFSLHEERIFRKGQRASQISPKRTNLNLNLSKCLPNAETLPTMLTTPVFSFSSAPLIGAAEEISSLAEEILIDHEDLIMTQWTAAEDNSNNQCNTLLDTSETADFTFEETLDELFTWNDIIPEIASNEQTIVENELNLPEEIWKLDSINDDESINMCVPPTVVEGTRELLNNDLMNEDIDFGTQIQSSDFENNDILKWIIDDQEIDDLPSINQKNEPKQGANFDLTNTLPTFFIEEVSAEPIKVEVKAEEFGEDEKYRKMRLQNNESSRKCRLKRKKKEQDMEEECELLQQRNEFLKMRVEEMEKEVKAWKKKLLSDIKNSSSLKTR